jgi:flagellar basal body-associated protein FliL
LLSAETFHHEFVSASTNSLGALAEMRQKMMNNTENKKQNKRMRYLLSLLLVTLLLCATAVPGFAATPQSIAVMAAPEATGGAVEPPVTPPVTPPDPVPEPETPPAQKPALELEIRDYPATMEVGDRGTISYVLKNTTDDTKIQFTASNSKIVAVDSEGNLAALDVGSTEIIVSAGTEKVSILIHVVEKLIPADELKIEVEEFTAAELIQDVHNLKVGDKLHLSAAVKPDDANTEGLEWEISDESVLDLNDKGVLKAIGEGESEVTVTLGDLSATLVFSVAASEGGLSKVLIPVIILIVLIAAAVIAFLVIRKKKNTPPPKNSGNPPRRRSDDGADAPVVSDSAETSRDAAEAPWPEPTRDESRMTKIFEAPLIREEVPQEGDVAGYEAGPDKRFSLNDIE